MAAARSAVEAAQFEDFRRKTCALWEQGDLPPR
jgi:hypothetical protein